MDFGGSIWVAFDSVLNRHVLEHDCHGAEIYVTRCIHYNRVVISDSKTMLYDELLVGNLCYNYSSLWSFRLNFVNNDVVIDVLTKTENCTIRKRV